MAYQPIGDYGIIGNMYTTALVGLNGSQGSRSAVMSPRLQLIQCPARRASAPRARRRGDRCVPTGIGEMRSCPPLNLPS